MKITLEAPAKVNLILKVLGPRADGYHELFTLMQPLSLGDELTLDNQASGLEFSCDDAGLSQGNLVERAARAYFTALGAPARARLRLSKRTPVAAGLGGGSSDAAAALLGLNALHRGALEPAALWELARGLGADVPFFLGGVTAVCRGVGDMVSPRPDFPLLHYVLVNPGFAVPTAWVYRQFDLIWTRGGGNTMMISSTDRSLPWRELLANDLEGVTMTAHPKLAAIKERLLEAGAWHAAMSGSGPTMFGLFDDAESAREGARRLAGTKEWWVEACRGIIM